MASGTLAVSFAAHACLQRCLDTLAAKKAPVKVHTRTLCGRYIGKCDEDLAVSAVLVDMDEGNLSVFCTLAANVVAEVEVPVSLGLPAV